MNCDENNIDKGNAEPAENVEYDNDNIEYDSDITTGIEENDENVHGSS